METIDQSQKKKQSIWLYVSIILFIISVILTWKLINYKAEIQTLIVEKEIVTDEKAQMIAKLEKLQKEYDQLASENENLSEMFQKEKEHVEKLLNQIRSEKGSLEKYKNKVSALEARLLEYEQQIEELKSQNKELVEENFVIKTSLDSTIIENVTLQQNNEALNDKVDKGSVLTAYDINAGGINTKNSGKEIPTVKSKKADKIRICFTIGENVIADYGKKDVFIRIADPAGKILSKGGDNYTFEFNGKQLQYSLKETIDYRNKALDLCLYWDKSGDFVSGTYYVDIFVEGNNIGTTSFLFEK